jgi:hypothetical protein
MRRTTLVLLVAFGLSSVPLRATCVSMPLEQQFAESTVIFVGRATAQQSAARTLVVGTVTVEEINTVTTFTVEQMWKGAPATEVRVTTCGGQLGDRGVTCSNSFTFSAGSTYLVFASGEPLQTSRCVPTALLEQASQTLEWLAKQPGTRSGR